MQTWSFLTSNNLLEFITSSDIIPGIRSDHSVIVLNIQLQKEANRGPGHWKINHSYLNDDVYVTSMNENVCTWLQDASFSDPRVKWEWIKYNVRAETTKNAKK